MVTDGEVYSLQDLVCGSEFLLKVPLVVTYNVKRIKALDMKEFTVFVNCKNFLGIYEFDKEYCKE